MSKEGVWLDETRTESSSRFAKKLHAQEKHLQALRMSTEKLVPILDRLPHSLEAKSRVEKIALEIIETETELTAMSEEYRVARTTLTNKILVTVGEPVLQTLLVLRYVQCLSYRETARRMHYTLRQVFRLREKAICHMGEQGATFAHVKKE